MVALVAVLLTLLALGLVAMSLALGNKIDLMGRVTNYDISTSYLLTSQQRIEPYIKANYQRRNWQKSFSRRDEGCSPAAQGLRDSNNLEWTG